MENLMQKAERIAAEVLAKRQAACGAVAPAPRAPTRNGSSAPEQALEVALPLRAFGMDLSANDALTYPPQDVGSTPGEIMSEQEPDDGGVATFSLPPVTVPPAERAWALKRVIDTRIAAGEQKQIAALAVLEQELCFVTDQGCYVGMQDRRPRTPFSIRQEYRSAMPRGPNGRPMDPVKLLEASRTKHVVDALDYHPGEGRIFKRADGRLKLNDYEKPPGPWRLPASGAVPKCVAATFAHVLPSENDAVRLLNKFAYLLQHPGSRFAHMTVVVGTTQGSGKTTISYDLPRALFGDRNVTQVGLQELDSNFNEYMGHCQILCAEEIAMQHSRDAQRLANLLKAPLTGATIRIIAKGLSGYNIENHMSMFGTSNHPDDAIALSDSQERRYDIMRAREEKIPEILARDFHDLLESPDGVAQIRDVLLSRQLPCINPLAPPPVTRAKRRMAQSRFGRAGDELRYAIENRIGCFDFDFVTLDEARNEINSRMGGRLGMGPHEFGKLLRDAVETELARWRLGNSHPSNYWIVRNHEAWQAATEKQRAEHRRTKAPPVRLVVPDAQRSNEGAA